MRQNELKIRDMCVTADGHGYVILCIPKGAKFQKLPEFGLNLCVYSGFICINTLKYTHIQVES